jgi:hypothetical protein
MINKSRICYRLVMEKEQNNNNNNESFKKSDYLREYNFPKQML